MEEDLIALLYRYLELCDHKYRDVMESLKEDVTLAEDIKLDVAFLAGIHFLFSVLGIELQKGNLNLILSMLINFMLDDYSIIESICQQLE